MPGKLDGSKSIASGTITTTQLATALSDSIAAGGGPKIKSLIYPGDDTAANTVGGQTIYINGSGFDSNVAVYVNNASVPSVTYISASNVGFTTPALSAATYPLYVTNPDDGATAILVPGLQISGEPTWVTGATLTTQEATVAWSISLSATGDTPLTYALAAGSSLPSGISLASNGVISGTMSSPPASETTYNFTVDVSDAQNQTSSRAFSVTVTTGEGVLFANNVLLIHANGTNNGNNHSFLDSSNNNFTITRNGNSTQGSFSPFSQTGWSAFFDGSGDYLTTSTNAAFGFGTGSFTIEAWVYPTNNPANGPGTLLDLRSGANAEGIVLRIFSNNVIGIYDGPNNTYLYSSGTVPINAWSHIAIVRSNTSTNGTAFYINGAAAGTTTLASNLGTSWAARVGSNYSAGFDYYGYISNLRIVKGTAVYTSNFTSPSAPLAPIANTSLLTCQDNNFIDEGPNNFAITRNGDTLIQPFAPFAPGLLSSNSHSVYFDGTGDYLTVADNAALRMGSGDFTIECWWQPNSLSSYQTLFDKGYTNAGALLWQTGSGDGRIIIYTGGSTAITSNTAVVVGNWTHMALVRSGTTLTLYQNGVSVGSATNSTDFTSTATVGIGANATIPGGGSLYPINGSISNFRMVKGTAVYTSAFTPPTSALTAITNTSLLACQSATLIDNSTNAFTITAYADARPRTFNPFGQTYTSSAYSTANVGGSVYFDGTGDYLTVPDNVAIESFTDFTIEFWVYFNSVSGTQVVVDKGWNGASISPYLIFLSSGSLVVYASSTGSSWDVLSGSSFGTMATGLWYHIALTRSGSSIRLFTNGSLITTVTNSSTLTNNASNLGVGASPSAGANPLSGYLSGLRIVKGTAVYTSAFTPPTAPVTNIANTSLLCNFTNAQIFDQTAKNILECIGDAKVSTAQYKYGSASIVFDGTGDGVLVKRVNENLKFGSSNFTIEGWVYFNSVSTRKAVFNGGWSTAGYASEGGFTLDIAGASSGQLSLAIGTMNSGGFWLTTSASPAFTTGQWYHIALVRNGTTITIYRDGVSIGSSTLTSSTTKFANMGTFNLGIYDDATFSLDGYIDEVRLTKGYARYTANFTAPTAAFQDK